ncbi:MAG: primase-helicase family protein [Bradyrhizobium sp.]|uniref:primase-helicase family protein n=1 Tax=Bradyrhizobium sp. TaxID=376 RepID=UPI003BF44B8C
MDAIRKDRLREMFLEEAREADAALLATAPTLRSYIARIGAKQRSLRRFVIEGDGPPEYGTMLPILAEIELGNGTFTCNNTAFAPTDEDLKAIKAETENFSWPRSIPFLLHHIDELKRALASDNSEWCEFAAPTGDHFVFVQQRRETANGKMYLPWTYWSDKVWRQLEPEGSLPLYNLPAAAGGWRYIAIHEGGMTAKRVAAMCRDKNSKHPWINSLRDYQHMGWPGGAERPHCVDWAPIQRLPYDTEIVLVGDNDAVGENALSKISRILNRPLKAVRFDNNFKAGFDLADEMPKVNHWWDGDKYKGPSFEEFIAPATWATNKVTTGKQGRPTFVARKEFAMEWIVCTSPAVFINRAQPSRLLTEKEFNRSVRPFSDADETGRLLEGNLACQVDEIAYSPREVGGTFTSGGKRFFNTYSPSRIKPKPGNAQPLEDFFEELVPNLEDRGKLKRWCATLIARPNLRMEYGVLLVSRAQGVGKSTLGERILAPLVGLHNVSFPSAKTLTESAYNSWLAQKRLAVVQEMYTGHSRATYDRLKSEMTERYVEVNRKYIDEHRIENWIHIFACSNSKQALFIDDDDRRWFVPAVTEAPKWKQDDWKRFHGWLEAEGLSITAQWAEDYVTEKGAIGAGERAPSTSAKRHVIEATRGAVQQLACDFFEYVKDYQQQIPGEVVFAIDDLQFWFAERLRLDITDGRLKKLTLRQALVTAGFHEPCRENGEVPRFKIKGSKSYIIATCPLGSVESWKDVCAAAAQKVPKDVEPRAEPERQERSESKDGAEVRERSNVTPLRTPEF